MHLAKLPIRILENVLSFLISPLSCYTQNATPKTLKELEGLQGLSDYRVVLEDHPFYRLAATCHTSRSVIDSFSHHLLYLHKEILCFEFPEFGLTTEVWQDRIKLWRMVNSKPRHPGERIRSIPPDRLMWVRWSYCHCLFAENKHNVAPISIISFGSVICVM